MFSLYFVKQECVKLLLGEFQKLKLISFSVLSQFVVGVAPHPREEAVEKLHNVGTFYFHQMMFTNFFCPVPWVLWGRGGVARSQFTYYKVTDQSISSPSRLDIFN